MSSPNNGPRVFAINLAEVQLPEIKPTRIKYNQTVDWVSYGAKNGFPQYLIDSVNKSTVHSRYIHLRQSMISGEGFSANEQVMAALKKINSEGQSADKLLKKIAVDMSILETFAVQVIYSKDFKKITDLYYFDSSQIRPHRDLDDRGNVIGYWICPDWNDVKRQKPKFYERFDTQGIGEGYKLAGELKDDERGKKGSQIFFYHKQALGQPYFPAISYASCLNAVELENELSKFGLNTVLNGFFSGAIMEVIASMTDEEKAKFNSELKATYTGSENANKLMVLVTEQEGSVKVTPFSTGDNTPMMNALKDNAVGQICTAHGGDPILANVTRDGSTLGSDGKLYRDALQIFHNLVIRELQEGPLELIKKYLDFNGFTDVELDITSRAIVSEELDIQTKLEIIKPEVVAAEYSYKTEDILPHILTKEQNVPAPNAEAEPVIE